jgi:integrase
MNKLRFSVSTATNKAVIKTPGAPKSRRRRNAKVNQYVAHAVAAGTRNAYASDLRLFRNWGGRIPATPTLVARYLAACAGKVKASTLERRLAAISSAHVALGKPSPTRSALVRTTMRGIRRVHGTAQVQAKPLGLDALRKITRLQKGLDPVRDLRDRTLLLVGFAGGFRRSELVGLTPESLHFDAQGVAVTLKRSKTDPQGKGRVVALPYGRGGMCPVKLLKAWLALLSKLDPEAETKRIFRGVDRYGTLGQGLGSGAVGGILRRRLAHCGLDREGYSAHSLRAGLVTAAAKAGVPTWAIQQQTGHKSENTVHRYIRGLSPYERNAFRSIVGGPQAPIRVAA